MVVSEKNLDEFLKQFREDNGQVAIVAMSIRGYQNMALNISEMERYIRQQKEVIVYYQEAIKPADAGKPEPAKSDTK